MPEEEKVSSPSQQMQYKQHKTLSSLKLVALSDAGPKIFTLNCPANEQETLTQDEGYPTIAGSEIAQFSPIHGKLLAVVSFQGIHIIDVDSKQ